MITTEVNTRQEVISLVNAFITAGFVHVETTLGNTKYYRVSVKNEDEEFFPVIVEIIEEQGYTATIEK